MRKLGPRLRVRESALPTTAGAHRVLAGTQVIRNDFNPSQLIPAYPVYTGSYNLPTTRETTWDEIHPGPPFESGGRFGSIKIEYPQFTVLDIGQYPCDSWNPFTGRRYWYHGGFFDPLWIPTLDLVPDSTYYGLSRDSSNATVMPDISALGSEAYKKLRPSVESASIGVAIAETRDLTPMLQQTSRLFSQKWKNIPGSNLTNASMLPKKAANTFLLAEFGWVPFLKDLHQISDVYTRTAEHIGRISRQNGQWLKRYRRNQTLTGETVVYSRTDTTGVLPEVTQEGGLAVGARSYTITLQELTEVWYVGRFKYYRPEFDFGNPGSRSLLSAIDRRLTIYGAQVNPTVVWKATPWTWLIDWFGDVDDKITALNDLGTDQVASKYMYLMHHQRRRFRLNSKFTTVDGKFHDLTWYRSCDIKRREPAGSPFDFVWAGSFNPTQYAILAALGISRIRP